MPIGLMTVTLHIPQPTNGSVFGVVVVVDSNFDWRGGGGAGALVQQLS